jgi:hypothetical protein
VNTGHPGHAGPGDGPSLAAEVAKALGPVGTRALVADLKAAECWCYRNCAENPATACSLSGRWHVHAGEPCPVHPDAPGDR